MLQGVLSAIPLAFIFPPLCVLRLQQDPILSLRSLPKLGVALFGIISSIIGLVMTILRIAEGMTCTHEATPAYCPQLTQSNLTNVFNSTTLSAANYTNVTGYL